MNENMFVLIRAIGSSIRNLNILMCDTPILDTLIILDYSEILILEIIGPLENIMRLIGYKTILETLGVESYAILENHVGVHK
jgi:hypothetical protein